MQDVFIEAHAQNYGIFAGLTKLAVRADEDTVAVRSSKIPSEIRRSRTPRRQEGFVLIATSIALTILLALAALGIDIGRMYVVRAPHLS